MPVRTITYGGFTFDFNRMTVDQQPRYGDNGIDQTGIAYTFNVEGFLTAATTTAFLDILTKIQCYLNKPRLAFAVRWGETTAADTWFSVDPSGDDIAWGPLPGEFKMQEIFAGRAIRYSWSLKVELKRCWDNSCSPFQRPSDVLSISRKYEHQVGPDGLTARTVSGRLEVTANSVQAGKTADYYRYLCMLPVPAYFQRDAGLSFSTSADGRFMDFSYSETEKNWTLPAPITSGSARFRVAISQMGARADYTLSGTFNAPVSVSKSQILDQILQLLQNRFPLNDAVGLVPTERSLEEDIYGSNSITFSFSAWSAAGAGADPLSPQAVYATFGNRPPNSNGAAQGVGAYGGDGQNVTSGVVAGAPAPYDSCVPPGTNGTQPGQPGLGPTVTIPVITANNGQNNTGGPGGNTTDISVVNTGISDDHKAAPYVAYYEELSFEIDNGYAVFYPKVAGAAPVVQRTREPKVMIIQCGYAQRDALTALDGPVMPPPFYDNTKAILHRASPNTSTPVPVGASPYNRYKISWNYLMEWKLPLINTADIGIAYPDDPRRPPGAVNVIVSTNLPALLGEG
ncbi:MAG: hypothetical protein JWO57_657 [Pseudonocardiales bacterium]|nr:hypothetical protein [Pseudonocardiales bacterium]